MTQHWHRQVNSPHIHACIVPSLHIQAYLGLLSHLSETEGYSIIPNAPCVHVSVCPHQVFLVVSTESGSDSISTPDRMYVCPQAGMSVGRYVSIKYFGPINHERIIGFLWYLHIWLILMRLSSWHKVKVTRSVCPNIGNPTSIKVCPLPVYPNDPILAHMERSWKPLSYANDTTHTGLKVFTLYKNDTSIVLKKQIDIFFMLWRNN